MAIDPGILRAAIRKLNQSRAQRDLLEADRTVDVEVSDGVTVTFAYGASGRLFAHHAGEQKALD